MARGNMLLGQAIGSVGDITFSRVNGKQVIKSKPSTVKNPQTKAQMIQRVILNTISQAYSKMSEICDHSFEGIAAGQNSMSYFMQRNLKLLRYELSLIGDLTASAPCFTPIGTNGIASNSYIIAKGQLPEILPTVSTGAVALALTANTYEAVLAATGMNRGEQLTIVTVSGTDLSDQRFNYSRIILDPEDANGEKLGLDEPFVVDSAINAPNHRNENTGHTYAFDNGSFEVSVLTDEINMGAMIASRQKADGSWQRSNASLLLAEGASIGYSMQDALDLYESGGIDVESSRYLNNAIKNVKAASASGHVAAPVINGNASFESSQSITISGPQGADVYYTTDGTEPTDASTRYTAAFTISASCTVKAVAIANGVASEVTSKTFTKTGGEPIPGAG